MVLLLRAILVVLCSSIGRQVQFADCTDATAAPVGTNEQVDVNGSEEGALYEERDDVSEDLPLIEDHQQWRQLGYFSTPGCCRRRRGCGDRRRAQSECFSDPPAPPRRRAPVTYNQNTNIHQTNNCGSNSDCYQSNTAEAMYVNCHLAQQDSCQTRGSAKVSAKGPALSNQACRQSIMSFWQKDVRAQSCGDVDASTRAQSSFRFFVFVATSMVLRF